MVGVRGQSETWTVAGGACEAMIDDDAVVADAECMKAVALGGEVLLLCRYARACPTRIRSSPRDGAVIPAVKAETGRPLIGPLEGHPP